MKSVRLLPVVIFAALALLVFKGIGIVSNGGYVLTGTSAAIAEDNSAGDTPISLSTPPDPSIADPSPTIGDTAPTLAMRAESSSAGPTLAEQSSLSASSQEAAGTEVCPDTALPPVAPSSEAAAHELNDRIGNALAKGCPSVEVPFNAYGDALPMTNDGKGKLVPLSASSGDDAEPALLQRLGERRTDLDKRQADLDLRAALVAAAEQKLEARTVELRQLEAKVNELVDQKQAAEDASFKAIVSMYETMKPKEAAKIFDTLELNVLLKVARAMNPRKMSPILAAMSPRPAEALTTAFASAGSIAGAPVSENLAALPQIVGQ